MEALILLPLIVLLLFNTIFTVQQQTFKVVERFGKYKRIARPGINVKIPFVDKASRAESMRIRQLDVPVETKTEDNVFVKVSISCCSIRIFILADFDLSIPISSFSEFLK